jgi:DNA polymerase elongation subunit (family B)
VSKTPIQRLFFDIETSPCIGLFWRPGYNLTVSHENVLREPAIICIAWKWAGRKRIHHLTWDSNQNDKQMLTQFIKVMHTADEIVAHCGDNFDIPWLRARCLKHRIPMAPTFVSIDTLKEAKSKFRFPSNRLDYIAQYLEIGKKVHTEFELWKRVMSGEKAALREMVWQLHGRMPRVWECEYHNPPSPGDCFWLQEDPIPV